MNQGRLVAKSASGRIVLEVDPILKRRLYTVLAAENKTLKQWFTENAVKLTKDSEVYLINSLVNTGEPE